MASEDRVEIYDVTISGQFIGAVLVGDYLTESRGQKSISKSLFDGINRKKQFIGIFDVKRNVLRCLIGKELREFKVTS